MVLAFNPAAARLYQPPVGSHKGQNGKLLVIGGSKLFHSSVFWSADMASRIVDLVHFTSPANENNELVRKKIKERFWTGIVIDWGEVEEYIKEDDAVLIGPGMIRSENTAAEDRRPKIESELDRWGKEDKTGKIVNFLLKKYPSKKWVIDGGALQEIDANLITKNCILTPHQGEFRRLFEKIRPARGSAGPGTREQCRYLSQALRGAVILLKGPADIICRGKKCVSVKGGNPGMTKGGTGDVLAGLTAALYCKNGAWTAAAAGSYIAKKAAARLFQKAGIYFNAQDLLEEIPPVMAEINRI